jgi:dihydropteroate synthase
MGVLNVTPDSFSDGGLHLDRDRAVAAAQAMIEAGADLIDIGGESTRPGAARIDDAEQIRRVIPVIQAVAKTGVTISIDTTRSNVAHAAIDAGASIVNDISAGREDPAIIALVASLAAPVILMHMQGTPATMQANPTYANVVADVHQHLIERARVFENAGVKHSDILIDPGIGFGKTAEHNLLLLKHLDQLVSTGYAVLIGTSRKGFIGKILNQPNPADRVMGTAATVAYAVAKGASIVRVHDVGQMKQVVTMIDAIANV